MPIDPPISFGTSCGSSYKRSVPMLCPSNGDVLATALMTTLRTSVNESLQMHFKVAVRNHDLVNANR